MFAGEPHAQERPYSRGHRGRRRSEINTSGRGIGLTAAKVSASGTPLFGSQMAD
ncbi:hypothetical protein [Streptomyces sp. AC550_RSS872]|uniref:hypothetical protein n=1 Tax=Streptomyces sp. AC550_RSS872 TaxID=2823689 RepID=UPI001C27D905|nr:hypothetical protein [Streptomyces sp. AC550_RSS872]